MRWVEQPNVLTMKEQGFNVEIDSWMGLAVPKGTPKDVVDKLQAAALASVRNPDVAKRLEGLGVDPSPLTGKQYEETLQTGYVEMGKAIKAANLPRIN
jgi:tripartite-type tricarboxylate transporter receptor subunit TctC